MRSIRWSLLFYFLLTLAGALGAVSFLVYEQVKDSVNEKEIVAQTLLCKQYHAQTEQEQKRLDAKLEAKARTLVSFARVQSTSRAERRAPDPRTSPDWWKASPDWKMMYSVYHGRAAAGVLPGLAPQFSSGLLDAITTAYFLPELQFNEEEIYRDKADESAKDYFQMDSNLWHTSWRSRSMGDHTFPISKDIFTDPSHPLLEPEWNDREIEPGHIVRCVSLKAPMWLGSYRFSWIPGAPPPPRNPNRGAAQPQRPADGPQFIIFVQCASDTDDRDAQLASLNVKRDEDVAKLHDESRNSLASLRKNLWLICAATFVITAVGGYVLVLLGLFPLKRVSEAVSKVTPKDFKLPLDQHRLPVELRPIVDHLNATLDLLKRAFAREKQAVADMSHDLRTPVASLLVATEVALRKPRTAEQYRDVIEDCHITGKQMHRLVEGLLALARLDAGVDRVRTCDFDVAELAEECVNLVRPLAAERQLDLQIQRNGSIPAHTDPDKVREVLTNLLHNAIQYNRPRGSVVLNVARHNGHVRFQVSDTGIGIAPMARERIFERFYREDPSRHGDSLGDMMGATSDTMHSGLGLAIVKGYVDLLGGSIRVDSAVGEGSTFSVEIPAQRSDRHHSAPPCDPPTKRSA